MASLFNSGLLLCTVSCQAVNNTSKMHASEHWEPAKCTTEVATALLSAMDLPWTLQWARPKMP